MASIYDNLLSNDVGSNARRLPLDPSIKPLQLFAPKRCASVCIIVELPAPITA